MASHTQMPARRYKLHKHALVYSPVATHAQTRSASTLVCARRAPLARARARVYFAICHLSAKQHGEPTFAIFLQFRVAAANRSRRRHRRRHRHGRRRRCLVD